MPYLHSHHDEMLIALKCRDKRTRVNDTFGLNHAMQPRPLDLQQGRIPRCEAWAPGGNIGLVLFEFQWKALRELRVLANAAGS